MLNHKHLLQKIPGGKHRRVLLNPFEYKQLFIEGKDDEWEIISPTKQINTMFYSNGELTKSFKDFLQLHATEWSLETPVKKGNIYVIRGIIASNIFYSELKKHFPDCQEEGNCYEIVYYPKIIRKISSEELD